jgi:hypothetical protein
MIYRTTRSIQYLCSTHDVMIAVSRVEHVMYKIFEQKNFLNASKGFKRLLIDTYIIRSMYLDKYEINAILITYY